MLVKKKGRKFHAKNRMTGNAEMEFRNYRDCDYDAVIDFLIQLSKEDSNHINWNWARLEWMIAHPETDKTKLTTIGLWWDKDRIVGAAIYDMYYGEAFCGALKAYMDILPEILDYAYCNLKDESGLGIAICDEDLHAIEVATRFGYKKADQTENILMYDLEKPIPSELPMDMAVKEYDPATNPCEFAWLLWQGFDHGNDKTEFERKDKKEKQLRKHLDTSLSLAAVDSFGKLAGYVCLWYSPKTDYAYVEPVCTIPEYRNKGIAKSLLSEAFRRAKKLGVGRAIVISEMDFYKKLGFVKGPSFSFYWKK